MACYHPLKAFVVGTNPETGKKLLKIRPYETTFLYKKFHDPDDKFYMSTVELCPNKLNCSEKLCLHEHLKDYCKPGCSELTLLPPLPSLQEVKSIYPYFITIPCGKCQGCRIDHSREWANRLIMEKQYSTEAYFLTLTYDNEHVPKSFYKAKDFDETGEIHESLTLRMDDVSKFLKNLRKVYGDGIRFYACGEYGEKTHRPHYHMILFNIHLDDLQSYGMSDSFEIQESPTISRIWNMGRVVIAPCNWQTCAYVTRYVTKKCTPEQRWKYEYFNIEPERCRMSRMPGIGRQWFDDHKEDIYRTYIIVFGDECNQYEFRPPKYFDRLMAEEQPEVVEKHKADMQRKALNNTRLKLTRKDMDYLELLEEEEYLFERKVSSLRRSKVE